MTTEDICLINIVYNKFEFLNLNLNKVRSKPIWNEML